MAAPKFRHLPPYFVCVCVCVCLSGTKFVKKKTRNIFTTVSKLKGGRGGEREQRKVTFWVLLFFYMYKEIPCSLLIPYFFFLSFYIINKSLFPGDFFSPLLYQCFYFNLKKKKENKIGKRGSRRSSYVSGA